MNWDIRGTFCRLFCGENPPEPSCTPLQEPHAMGHGERGGLEPPIWTPHIQNSSHDHDNCQPANRARQTGGRGAGGAAERGGKSNTYESK